MKTGNRLSGNNDNSATAIADPHGVEPVENFTPIDVPHPPTNGDVAAVRSLLGKVSFPALLMILGKLTELEWSRLERLGANHLSPIYRQLSEVMAIASMAIIGHIHHGDAGQGPTAPAPDSLAALLQQLGIDPNAGRDIDRDDVPMFDHLQDNTRGDGPGRRANPGENPFGTSGRDTNGCGAGNV